ncbi:helix-turn-helix transcriptional regulator [Bradyrhizobium sp. CB82]|uniref:helix-turn-helix domain-containing protein n=1 Tax=Bradyrhizobium sp. CB82 TaxID=3039159 RepID=UPI0024B17E2C|nr:helix-turn-helix transcriptional regulator [Bradyrhizobium sp. CB82]WFU39516.1 helix-turn-helix transcriptional regulator [Bradyrhizobium sp. CB82]
MKHLNAHRLFHAGVNTIVCSALVFEPRLWRCEEPPNAAFGKIIAGLRQTARLSQEGLADHAAIHRTYVSQIERGLKSPTIVMLLRLAKALDTTPSRILKSLEGDLG